MRDVGDRRLPAIMLSGFPGAGKTRLLNHVPARREGRRVAVIVNGMPEAIFEADLALAQTKAGQHLLWGERQAA